MKRLVCSAVSLGALAVSGAVHAQSSVTLYGIIDDAIAFTHNDGGSNNYRMLAGNMSGSRWGLKGAEDLGGGLKAIFQLENGFDPNTGKFGNNGEEFGRQAFVGLASDTWGTFTAGKQYAPDTDLVQAITADNYFGSLFATPGDVDNYDNSIRISNAVKYTSPVYAGFQGEVLYGFGQQSGSISTDRAWGAALAYNNGPVALAASYQFYDGGDTLTDGIRNFSTTTTDSVFNGTINNGYTSAKSIKIARVAGMYTIGPFGLGLSYSNSQYTADDFSAFTSTEKYNTGNAFVNYQATPALLTSVGYSYVKSSGDTGAKYNQISVGADYSLSKRTDLYLAGVFQHATGEIRSADGTDYHPG